MRDSGVFGRIAGELLVVFDVAMRERCTHRSAVRLGLTEPDILGALSELEAQVGRVLFVVAGHELMPTVHAWRFADALRSGAPLHFE